MQLYHMSGVLHSQDVVQREPCQCWRSVRPIQHPVQMTSIDIWDFISFGQGIYTSSASNKYVPSSSMRYWRWLVTRSASYSPNGIMFLNKVVLGKVHNVGQFEAVKSCPSGSNSVSSFRRRRESALNLCTGCFWQIERDHRLQERCDQTSVSHCVRLKVDLPYVLLYMLIQSRARDVRIVSYITIRPL